MPVTTMRPSGFRLVLTLWAAGACPGPGAPTGVGTAHSGSGASSSGVLAFLVQPSNAPAGRPINPAVKVQAQDTLGNVLTGFTGNVSIAIGTNPSSGTLSGTTSAAASSGVVIFDTLTINAPGSGYTLVATASGFPSVTSAPFVVFGSSGSASTK